MSIFGNIMSTIFGKSAEAAPQQSSEADAVDTSVARGRGIAPQVSSKADAAETSVSGGGGVDVAAIMDGLARQTKQKLNWRTSIVDLMKLLDLDSSLSARKNLAEELNYTGDMNKSAPMNIWLHKQVMTKLAENGGKIPDELKD